ncbi:MAG TPA: FG-GAP-like repeat-containing protein [Candidatus Eisenbacteria bacterium]|nr:FG-GAP-like repeat-containing protein [Candidatus Eisenbacteria bacterium]
MPPATGSNVSLYRSSMSYPEGIVRNNTELTGYPVCITSGDFNGDGNPDFAVANLDSGFAGSVGSISILTHAGSQYLPPLPWSASAQPDFPALNATFFNYPVPPNGKLHLPLNMVARDFNGDGRTDIAVARYASSAILWNTGQTPASGQQFVAKSSTYASEAIGTADFDNDGVLEIVGLTSGAPSNLFARVFHTAADTLQLIGTTMLGPLAPRHILSFLAIADVTGDGLPDVIAVDDNDPPDCAEAAMYVATGYNAGTFTTILGPFAPGSGVLDLAVAPLDGDAIPDVVTTTFCANAVRISTGHPGGTFDPGVSITLPHAPEKICLGDLDGDGDTDIVTLASNSPYIAGTVCVVKGNGDGTFGPPVLYDGLPRSSAPDLLINFQLQYGEAILVDVNRDGRLDLVATEMGTKHTIGVLLNDGSGGFRSGTRSGIAQRTYRQAIADFNRDGFPDVASSGMSEVTIGFGNGTGKFTQGPSFTVTQPTTLVAGDINRDAKMDVLVQTGSSFRPYLGNGDGTFTPHQILFGGLVYSRSIADITRDGNPDMVAVDGQNVKIYAQNQFGFWMLLYQFQGPVQQPWGLAIADWNRDGLLDIALASDLGIHAYISTGIGTWTPNPVPIGSGRFKDVCAGDFNRDGYVDLAGRLDTSGTSVVSGIQVFLNGPSGLQPAPSGSTYTTLEKRGFFLDSWDADIDGIPDLIASGSTGIGDVSSFSSFDVLLGNGMGAFGLRTSYAMGTIDERTPPVMTSGEYLAAGDVDRDGIPDLMAGAVVSPDSSQVYTALTSPPTYTASLHDAVFKTTLSNPKDVAVGDLDRDGKLDVVTGTEGANPGVAVHRGGGGGTIGSPTTLAQSWYGTRVRLADLNRDGILDIVGASSVAGAKRIYTMLGMGNLTFGARVDYLMNVGSDIEVGDMNRDGIPDVVVSTPDSVRVLTGTGTGTFTAFSGVALAAPIHEIDLADLNRDGVLDVLCANGVVSVIYGNANGTLGTPVTTGVQSQTAQVVCSGDLNRDGYLDIVANQGNGYFVSFGDATFPFGSSFISFLSVTAFDMEIAPMAADGRPYLVASSGLDRVEVASVGAFGAFTSAGIYPVSATPESEVLADMDRDGLLDVVSVGSAGSTVAINLRGTGTVTAVEPSEAPAPRVVQLHQNYPNPFNPETTIRFTLPESRKIRLTVHDAQGRLVAVLANQQIAAGRHEVPWHGKNAEGHPVASGVYFYRLATDDGAVQSKRMVLVK